MFRLDSVVLQSSETSLTLVVKAQIHIQDSLCCVPINSLSPLHFMDVQEELPLQDTRAGAPPSGAQRLCLQPHQKQYGCGAASKSSSHRHPQPSPPDVQVARPNVDHLDFTASLSLIKAASTIFH